MKVRQIIVASLLALGATAGIGASLAHASDARVAKADANETWMFGVALNAKRQAARFVRNISNEQGVSALDVLFNEIGPKMKDRQGGYTRRLKLGNRRGDDAPIVVVAWVE